MIEAFSDKVQRAKVGNRFEFIYFLGGPPKVFLAFPVEAVLTGD